MPCRKRSRENLQFKNIGRVNGSNKKHSFRLPTFLPYIQTIQNIHTKNKCDIVQLKSQNCVDILNITMKIL